jgi:hypothetical protein
MLFNQFIIYIYIYTICVCICIYICIHIHVCRVVNFSTCVHYYLFGFRHIYLCIHICRYASYVFITKVYLFCGRLSIDRWTHSRHEGQDEDGTAHYFPPFTINQNVVDFITYVTLLV